MMQKYRAWHIKEKEMMGVLSMEFDGEGLVSLVCLSPKRMADDPRVPCELNDVVLMQCLGLKDKKGQDIFEGDIYVWTTMIDGKERESVNRAVVKDLRQMMPSSLGIIKVIGNIHENPELLKEEL